SQEEAFVAWRRFFEALAEEHAVVLVFEDIQWADDGLLDFIEHLADWVRDVPMLILCTARLDLLERRPGWGGGKLNSANVALGAPEQQLHPLQQKEFVQRARRSSVEGETEYAFKHLLVRDVAYGQVPRADRAQKHLRTAEWIESLGRTEDQAEMVAHHYVSAFELARAAGQDVSGITSRMGGALREAGDRGVAG